MPNIEDPIVRSARREAIWAVVVWAVAISYTMTVCYFFGYRQRSIEEVSFVLWFPDWIFWGIITPWFVATVVTIYFALCVMGDEPLGAESDLNDAAPVPGGEVDRV